MPIQDPRHLEEFGCAPTDTVHDVTLRILMVSPGFLPIVGGVETHSYEVARRLVRRGVDVTVLTTDRTGTLPREETIEGIVVRRVPAYPSGRDWYIAPAIVGIIRAGDWDVVHCQGAHTFVPPMAMAAARSAGLPYVVTFHSGGHSSAARHASRTLQLSLLRPLLMSSSRLIAVSKFEAEHLAKMVRLSRRRFQVIPNGAEMPPSTVHATDSESSDRPLIVSVGRLERFKGHHRVVEALPRVAETYPGIRLEIIGTGPYEAELRGLVHRLDLEGRVVIRSIATADRQAMADLLASADLVTLMSEFESHGLAAVEAVVLRRPLLVANASALKELVDEGFARGVSLDAGSNELAAAIVSQLADPLNTPDRPLPTWEDCTDRLQQVYKELVA
jgi:glycosyltransferase involved in cell wall biosynthesis